MGVHAHLSLVELRLERCHVAVCKLELPLRLHAPPLFSRPLAIELLARCRLGLRHPQVCFKL